MSGNTTLPLFQKFSLTPGEMMINDEELKKSHELDNYKSLSIIKKSILHATNNKQNIIIKRSVYS